MRFTGIILFLLILLQAANTTLSVLFFQINRNYIANTLCVNRNNLRSCCRGKCYLRKQLEAENSAKSGPSNPYKIKLPELSLFYKDYLSVIFPRHLASHFRIHRNALQYISAFCCVPAFKPPRF